MRYRLLFLCLIFTTPAAAETVPIPPKRPDVMNVSPAFIEELKKRDSQPAEKTEPPQKEDKKPESRGPLPMPSETEKKHSGKNELVDLKPRDLLDILEGTTQTAPQQSVPQIPNIIEDDEEEYSEVNSHNIPIPRPKPNLENMGLNNIEPAAQDDGNTTLVSFVLEPEQIRLDPNLEIFLQEHALKLFRENKGMMMEIQAYATPIEGEEHSDVRISLARALEVRSFLITNNVAASRLKLSPMGYDQSSDMNNRIDLLFLSNE